MSSTSSPSIPLAADGLSPAERLILFVFKFEGVELLPQSELIDESGMPSRTARSAITSLADRGIVRKRPDPRDGRRKAIELLADDTDESDTVEIPRRPPA